ncbi:MAG: exonuclease SbcCD subunit D [Chloroflexaceae bacterium]|nr:exonuclease SbcCD subunit D [Chloroflexaceae bacterium]
MIRLLHLADLHIGVENYGRIDPASGLHTRLQDYLARLDEALELVENEGVDLVLIAGDIYKNRTPNPTHQREFAVRIGRLRMAGVPVFILVGNHDVAPAVGRAHSVEIFNTLAIEGMTIADRPNLHVLATRSGPVQIIALPWVTRHHLLTREDMRLASFSEIEAMMRQRIERFISDTVKRLDPAIPAVLTLHGTVDGALPGAERGLTLGKDLVLPRSILALPEIDYVAMGHIHRHQSFGEHPPMVYAGSIERVDFGELEEEKGCILVDLEKGATRWRFCAFATRPFVRITVDIRGSSDPQERIVTAIKRHDIREAVVRVEIQATREQASLLQELSIRDQLVEEGAFVVAAVAVEVPQETRRRFAEADQETISGMTVSRALEWYLQTKNYPPERVAALLAAADELLPDINDYEGDAAHDSAHDTATDSE